MFAEIPFSAATFDNSLAATEQHLRLLVTLGERVRGSCHRSLAIHFIGEAMHILYLVTAGVETARTDRFFRRIGMMQLGGIIPLG